MLQMLKVETRSCVYTWNFNTINLYDGSHSYAKNLLNRYFNLLGRVVTNFKNKNYLMIFEIKLKFFSILMQMFNNSRKIFKFVCKFRKRKM